MFCVVKLERKGKNIYTLQYFTDTTDYRNYEKYEKNNNSTYNSGCLLFSLYEERHAYIYTLSLPKKNARYVKYTSFNTC